jgi:hypothetical protein
MDADQLEKTVGSLVERRPFRTFTIELLEREIVEIDHPRMICMRDGTAAGFKSGGCPFWFRYRDVVKIRSEN